MRKNIILLFFFIVIVSFSTNVYAKGTTNGVPIKDDDLDKNAISLYCSYYNGDYIKIMRNSSESEGSIISSSEISFLSATNVRLKASHFMNADGTTDCPLYIFGDPSPTGGPLQSIQGFTNANPEKHNSDYVYVGLNTSESSCAGMCSGDWWTCVYSGREGRIITQYDNDNGYRIYFPNGQYKNVTQKDISANCDDLYYNRRTQDYQFATSENSSKNDYNLCKNRNDIDYYCEGDCRFPGNAKLDCYDIDNGTDSSTNSDGTRNPMYEDGELSEICNDEKIQNTLKFVGRLLFIVKIIVPLLLIIFGTIDFGKAIAASKDDSVAKAGKMLVLRIVIGIVIFLVPTVVNFVFQLVGHGNTSYNECRICIFEPKLCGRGR